MQRIPTTDGSFVYRYDPYALRLLPGNSYHDKVGAAIVFCEGKKHGKDLKPTLSEASPQKSQKAFRRAHNTSVSPPPALDRSCSVSVSSNCGLSDAGSDSASPCSMSLNPVLSPLSSVSSPSEIARSRANTTHYARVQTKYGLELFIAPFRTASGDLVVIEHSAGFQHIGVVQSITTDAPITETRSRVVRHARDADKCAYAQLQARDLATCKLISDAIVSSPLFAGRVEVLGVEWLLDLSGVNVLCSHCGLEGDEPITRALQHVVHHLVNSSAETPVNVNVLCSPGPL